MLATSLREYLRDPLLATLMTEIKAAGPIRSSLLDITHKCNLRCDGCYYFSQEMDQYRRQDDESAFDRFIEMEKARDVNMLTIVGGEPALEIARLRKLAKHFHLTVVTNGSLPIPMEGLESIRIAVSFWGDETRDTMMRGNGNQNIFEKALSHFKNDPRVGFYYTTVPGFTDRIEKATAKMVENGNFVAFNFYGDIDQKGGAYSHLLGYEEVNRIIFGLAQQYSSRVISSPHLNRVIDQRHLFGQSWGYDVCPSLTYDHPANAQRMREGKAYQTKFRAYYADLTSTRRCCVGEARDCNTCTDLWATYAWILGSMKSHLSSLEDFSSWLFTTYLFYASSGFIDWHHAAKEHLPAIYRRFASFPTFANLVDVGWSEDTALLRTTKAKTNYPVFPLMSIAEEEMGARYGH